MSERGMRTLGVDVVFLDPSQDMVELTVPEKTTDAEITSTLSTHNGERVEHGGALMNAVRRSTGWTRRPVEPDITWVDSPFAQ